jgi:hypothetical protein
MKFVVSSFAACIAAAAAAALPASAGPFTSTITDTAVISVQGTGIQMTRVGSEYRASGVGIEIPNNGFNTNGTHNTYKPTSDTGTFQFTESFREADADTTELTVAVNTGLVTTFDMYGQATIQYAGTAGSNADTATTTSISMPLVSTTTGPTTVESTASGPVIKVANDASGITAQAQRSISLTVFD